MVLEPLIKLNLSRFSATAGTNTNDREADRWRTAAAIADAAPLHLSRANSIQRV